MRYFVLSGSDASLAMPFFETRIVLDEVEKLRVILGDCADDDPDLAEVYTLDEGEIVAINAAFGTSYISRGYETLLGTWHAIRLAPYLIHTGFELPLMLEGRTPMAFFSDCYPSDRLDETSHRFEPYVADGRIAKRIHDEPLTPDVRARLKNRFACVRYMYFVLPGEDWRVDEHLALCERLRNVLGTTLWSGRRALCSVTATSKTTGGWRRVATGFEDAGRTRISSPVRRRLSTVAIEAL